MQFDSLLHTNSEKVWTTTALKGIIPSEVSAGIQNGIYLSPNRIKNWHENSFTFFTSTLFCGFGDYIVCFYS